MDSLIKSVGESDYQPEKCMYKVTLSGNKKYSFMINLLI